MPPPCRVSSSIFCSCSSVSLPSVHPLLNRDAADGGQAADRHHLVAVAAQHIRLHVLHGDADGGGDVVAVAGAVQNARLADDALRRQARRFERDMAHGVERVGDDDVDGVRAGLRRPAWRRSARCRR